MTVDPGDVVRFIEPTSRKIMRIGRVEHVLERGPRRGMVVVIVPGDKRFTIRPDTIRARINPA